jgi:pimeloyl-ACP methyl ester carboxylesterase
MFVREIGAGSGGPAVLWLHGLGGSGSAFEAVAGHPRMARRRHLIPDLPGYGESAWARQPLGLADHGALLAAWLSQRGEEGVRLVGHSMGGVVGQILAEEHPGVLSAFVNVEGNLSPADCTVSGQAAAQPLEAFLAGGFEAMLETTRKAGERDPVLRAYHASMSRCDPRAYHRNALELVEQSARQDLARRLASLTIPACYLAGVPGGAPPRSLDLLEEAGRPAIKIRPSGHCPFLDQPGAFAEALDAFLLAASA